MRLIVLLSVALLAASGAAAQEVGSGSVALPVHGTRPTEVVARLARQAMATPSDSAAWKALAGALPELALVGSADHVRTLEAARLADSLSVSSLAHTPSNEDGAAPPLSSAEALLARVPATARTGAIALFAILLTVIVVWRVRARPSPPVRDRPSSTQAGRLWTAQTLASGGTDLPEIARRMGIAQEAVTLALRMAGTDTKTVSLDTPSAPSAGPVGRPRTEAHVRMRREILAGVSRLRDQRHRRAVWLRSKTG